MPHHSPHKGQRQQHRVHAAQYAKRAVGQLLQRRIVGRILARFSGIIKVTVQVGRPLGNVLGGPDRAQGLVIAGQSWKVRAEGALGSFPDCRQYILRTDGWLVALRLPLRAGRVPSSQAALMHRLRSANRHRRWQRRRKCLILGGTADRPIKAARHGNRPVPGRGKSFCSWGSSSSQYCRHCSCGISAYSFSRASAGTLSSGSSESVATRVMAPIASAKEPSLKSESPHTPYQRWFSAQKMPPLPPEPHMESPAPRRTASGGGAAAPPACKG